jgi:hypothetical protein
MAKDGFAKVQKQLEATASELQTAIKTATQGNVFCRNDSRRYDEEQDFWTLDGLRATQHSSRYSPQAHTQITVPRRQRAIFVLGTKSLKSQFELLL